MSYPEDIYTYTPTGDPHVVNQSFNPSHGHPQDDTRVTQTQLAFLSQHGGNCNSHGMSQWLDASQDANHELSPNGVQAPDSTGSQYEQPGGLQLFVPQQHDGTFLHPGDFRADLPSGSGGTSPASTVSSWNDPYALVCHHQDTTCWLSPGSPNFPGNGSSSPTFDAGDTVSWNGPPGDINDIITGGYVQDLAPFDQVHIPNYTETTRSPEHTYRWIPDAMKMLRRYIRLDNRNGQDLLTCQVEQCQSAPHRELVTILRHMERKHFRGIKLYECEVCPAKFVSEAIAKRHQVCQIKQFACGICEKKFAREDYQRYHERRHSL